MEEERCKWKNVSLVEGCGCERERRESALGVAGRNVFPKYFRESIVDLPLHLERGRNFLLTV